MHRLLRRERAKPTNPYVNGWRFTVRQHIPPPPTPMTDSFGLNDKTGTRERRKLHPVQRCIKHPPLQGSDGPFSIELQICKILQAGNEQNAQLVLVEVISVVPLKALEKGKRVVAKIYDPLYLNDDGGFYDPFVCVDNHYTHEVAAYMTLSDVQGSMIPEYYGSFSLKVPVDASNTREVRLILIEYIPGRSMWDISPKEVPQRDRQNIMKAIIQFETLAYTRDILLPDLKPRNVVVANTSAHEKAVCIDFGDAQFGRGSIFNSPVIDAYLLPGTYISPLLRWHAVFRTRMLDFAGWIDWDWQPWLETEFKHTAFTITPKIRETFLPTHMLEAWWQSRKHGELY
ncbi:hypothetical protein F9C07_7148 [Aspergillus flavus]|uniref:Protein kinase domain-containing protein n=1 Tax=Aspergillus flavus (strain ATCC 200026 / FGSC A1120 / IAM 13836 / NRRL 3357 / JCM 12722 / SRRC 167) TaxID=332952 RepID=A0A7U2MM62_ASPFN|nr:uncharacterized protein G4B84_005221 [Aspergillus flavus NRRL3357]KAF7620295.1 hypothetical protein AFLA_005604 [Aspergillus flavus NRRL3357]QMW29886.1 hypothetical protein G4B84_005221 [Aspergillus flavus NRRL3357]QRD86301.1 hypothetical protein F9C07_7148 [Aspergillus flavus]